LLDLNHIRRSRWLSTGSRHSNRSRWKQIGRRGEERGGAHQRLARVPARVLSFKWCRRCRAPRSRRMRQRGAPGHGKLVGGSGDVDCFPYARRGSAGGGGCCGAASSNRGGLGAWFSARLGEKIEGVGGSNRWLGRGLVLRGRLGSDGGGACHVRAGLARTMTSSDKQARLVSGSARRGGVPLRLGG
jgi:hypothetical protein